MKKIIPTILTDDFLDLETKLKQLKGLTDWIQIDIADGKFVNNVSIRLEDLSKTKLAAGFNLEAHLMVLAPEKYFSACQKANVKRVVFHLEAAKKLNDILDKAKKFDFLIGIALNPQTPIAKIKPYLKQIDLVLLLAVQPGFQGQKFLPSVLAKIKNLRKIAPETKIEIDGGVNPGNIKKIAEAGADYIVVGSYLFRNKKVK